MPELLARIEARLGRPSAPRRVIEWQDVRLDLDARAVFRAGEQLAMTAHELNVLAWLVERAGRAITRSYLAESALPDGRERGDRTIDSHISRIRAKLGPAGAAIRTVWGVGYRFDPDSSEGAE